MSNPSLQALASFVLETLVPVVKAVPALSGAASNLEWNAKKFLGQVANESLDEATFSARLKEDLEKAIGTVGGTGRVANELKSVLAKLTPPVEAVEAVAAAAPAAAEAPAAVPAPVTQAAPAAVAAPAPAVDLGAVLGAAAARAAEKLDWQHSVVDLLKLLGQDSSLAARKVLAGKLGLDVSQAGSAAGNTALHQALLGALAKSGGAWPSDLA